jgi:tetratricopeptide (TPR) repeat protein
MPGELQRREARRHYVLGLVMSGLSRHEWAAELFRSALAYDPALVAARVHLGVAYGHAGAYREMIEALTKAVRRDPPAARAALVEEPEEVAVIDRLFATDPMSETAQRAGLEAMPREFVEAGELVELGRRLISEGKDAEAVEALERSLRIDPTFPLAVALLCLAYLLVRETAGAHPANMEKSMLWEIDPTLTELLFKH